MKIASLAATGLLAVATALAFVAPAGSASSEARHAKAKPDCPRDALCLWDEENFQGQRVVVRGNGLSNKIYTRMNDLTSSVFLNRKDRFAGLYLDVDGQGAAYCLGEANRWRNNKLGAPFDDSISSTEVKRNVPLAC